MARRYKKSSRMSQKQYRARLKKYNQYLETTTDESPKSFRVWNSNYRTKAFYRREYKIYKERFEKRQASSRYGFRLTRSGEEVTPYNFRDFVEQYKVERNTLQMEVEEGERERVGSVVNELINDQAYELSSRKAAAVADYLIREERQFLVEKKLITTKTDEEGNSYDVVKRKNLELLIRQGRFVREEVGLWSEIKDVYAFLTGQGMSAAEAKKQIGQTYFKSK